MATSPDIALLREIATELRAIRQLLETPANGLSRSDRAALERLLPAIAGVVGGELFAAREIVESAAPALVVASDGHSARRLGKLLRRAIGQPVAGYIVRHEGTEAGAQLWRIEKLVQFPRV